MSDYRRAFVSGGCFFFTVVTHARQRLFDEAENVDRLREGFRRTMEKHPFKIDAIAILPDHLHTIWQLPENDSDFSLRWRLIKHYLASGIPGTKNHLGEKLIWQRCFWEHLLVPTVLRGNPYLRSAFPRRTVGTRNRQRTA
jgi:putative transposase